MRRAGWNRRNRTRSRGFTLLEVLVALTVLSIGVMGFLALQYYSINGRVFAKRMNEAVLTGNTTAEETITGDFSVLMGSGTKYNKEGGNEADPTDYDAGKAHEVEWAVYDWLNVVSNPNSELAKLKTLSMGVGWKEKATVRSMRVHTVLRGGRGGDTPQ